MTIFRDRIDAGQRLATELAQYAGRPDLVVLALPRGGVPVGFEVAQALKAPLDVFLVRKLGLPGHEELALGAISSGDTLVLNDDVVEMHSISDHVIQRIATRERAELERRERTYRGHRQPVEVQHKFVILVDDGIATGASMRAAVEALHSQEPAHMIVAVPTAPPDACRSFGDKADQVVCLITPEPFGAVGAWYADFAPTTDEDVQHLLDLAANRPQSDVSVRPEQGRAYEQESFEGR